MAIQTTVLQKSSSDSPAAGASARAYAELATRLAAGDGGIIAFGSVNRREGVTHTIQGLADELDRAGGRVTVVDPMLEPLQKRELSELRARHDWVLVDCGSLDASMELLRLAPLADGVVLVTESGRTAREQVERAAQLIREARGKLLGFVLNKRRYPVPGWLYRGL